MAIFYNQCSILNVKVTVELPFIILHSLDNVASRNWLSSLQDKWFKFRNLIIETNMITVDYRYLPRNRWNIHWNWEVAHKEYLSRLCCAVHGARWTWGQFQLGMVVHDACKRSWLNLSQFSGLLFFEKTIL